MKPMQSTFRILFIFSVLLWSCQSEAQRPKFQKLSPEQIAEKQTARQIKTLDLNKEQAQTLETINFKYAELLQAEIKSRQESRKASFAKMKDIIEAQNEEVKTILSENQYSNYIALRRQNLAKLRKRRIEKALAIQDNRKQGIEALNLSNTQKEKLKSIKTKYAKEMKALRAQDNVQGKLKEFKRLSEEQDKEVKAILSEEQFEMYLRIKKEKLQKRKSKMRKNKN